MEVVEVSAVNQRAGKEVMAQLDDMANSVYQEVYFGIEQVVNPNYPLRDGRKKHCRELV